MVFAEIKKQIEELGVSFFEEKEIYNQVHDNDTHYVFLCHASRYLHTLKNDSFKWFDIVKCTDIFLMDIQRKAW